MPCYHVHTVSYCHTVWRNCGFVHTIRSVPSFPFPTLGYILYIYTLYSRSHFTLFLPVMRFPTFSPHKHMPSGCPKRRDCDCSPCDNSLDIPLPTVEVELHHATKAQFVVTITWNQTQCELPGVIIIQHPYTASFLLLHTATDVISGYTVILSGGQSDSCQDILDLSTFTCTEQCTSLPPVC